MGVAAHERSPALIDDKPVSECWWPTGERAESEIQVKARREAGPVGAVAVAVDLVAMFSGVWEGKGHHGGVGN
jgi:hypothetical protein